MMKRMMLFSAAIALAALAAAPAMAQTPVTVTTPQISTDTINRTATLSWTAPTIYTDGTPITEALSYNVYAGLCSLTDLPKVQGPLTALTIVLTNQPSGDMCYQLTAQTPNGGESARTVRGSKTFPFRKPNPPPSLTVG